MNRPLKGLCVISDGYPELFSRILGADEYASLIEAAGGDAGKLREIFWQDLGDDYHWEFIGGEIVLRGGFTSGTSAVYQRLSMLLSIYIDRRKDSGKMVTSRCVCTLGEQDFSPAIMFFRQDVAKTITPDTNRFPAPQFVVEMNNDRSSESLNRGFKMIAYAQHSVEEYWIIDAGRKTVEQYIREGSAYDLREIRREGMLHAAAIPGFEIPHRAIFEEDTYLQVFQNILKND